MKRLIFLLTMAIGVSGSAFSQAPDDASTPILLNYSTLQKKVAKSDEAIADEKKSLKAKTWTSRGNLFQDVDNLGLEQVQLGIDTTTLKLFYNKPISKEIKGEGVEAWHYESINYIIDKGRLRGWIRVKPISEAPLDEALSSYKKAIDLTEADKQMKLQEKLKKDFDELISQYLRQGLNDYYLNDYPGALKSFESILTVKKLPVYMGVIDTTIINYFGITARDLGTIYKKDGKNEKSKEMYRTAIGYYSQLADLGFGGSTVYRQMTGDYYMIGDTLGAIKNLKKGIKQYPDSTVLVSLAAQGYYQLKDSVGGLNFIAERLKQKPHCAVAYYWKGLIITNHANVEEETIKEALAYYDTSLMYDPTDASVWYQTGYVNYAVGANYFEQAGYEEDPAFRKELTDKGDEYYEAAIEKLEKAYEVTANNKLVEKESLDLLKRIYYKLYGGEDERYTSVVDRMKKLE